MSKLPRYEISIDPEHQEGDDKLGISMIAYTANPAIITKGLAFEGKQMRFADELKMRVAAPILIPNQPIYREDEELGAYEVIFTESVIEQLFQDFMLNKDKNQFNLDHKSDVVAPSYILEAWITDEPEVDRSFVKYGIKVPKGSVFVVSQFTDMEYFKNEIIAKDRTGFSIEGFLGLSLEENIKKQLKQSIKETFDGVEVFVIEPTAGETESEFMSRCVPYEINKGIEQEQAVAICISKYNDKNKTKQEMKKNEFALADGEYPLANGDILVVKDGISEIKKKEEAPVEAEAVAPIEAEVAPVEAEVAPVEAAVDPSVDTEAILAIVQPKLDELYSAIAELKTLIEVADVEEEPVVSEEMKKFERQIPSLKRLFSNLK